MSIRDHAATLLQSLAEELSLDDASRAALALDENNETFITLENRFVVALYLDEEVNVFMISLPIAPLPQDASREQIMLDLLHGNYSWNLTGGGTLGVDQQTGLITLCYLVPLPLQEPTQFVLIINKLISVADYWKDEIQEETGDAAPAMGEVVPANYIRG